MITAPPKLYLPGLLGLRFIAAFTVYFAHLQQAMSWVRLPPFPIQHSTTMANDGVTLFFVLSGFLITYLLLTEKLATGTIQIQHFYTRRLLRIWPLYYLFTFFTFFAIPNLPFVQFPHLDMTVDGDFYQRFWLYIFMSPHVAITLFTHPGVGGPLWSVGVEEYFYVLWPQILKRLTNALPIGFAIVILIPMAARIYGGATLGLFFYFCRVDCMAIGALAAWIYLYKRHLAEHLFSAPIQFVAYSLAIRHIRHTVSYGVFTDLVYSSVFAVIILNIAMNKNTFVRLENRFFRFMGEISYGFYVFQWLVNVICIKILIRSGGIEDPFLRDVTLLASTFSMTTALATLSYHYWEKRFLILKNRYETITVAAVATDSPASEPAFSLHEQHVPH